MSFLRQKQLLRIANLMALALLCVVSAHAQEPQVSQLNAPPPIKVISKEERAQIESTHDSKSRLHLTIVLADTHLTSAEQHTTQQNYEAASTEIGAYHALMENVLNYLASLKRDTNKTRDLYKHLEMALRSDGPRLTAMRRVTPLEFAVRIKEVEDFAREGRTEALNSFYGHTVVRDQDDKPIDKPKEEPTPTPTPKIKTP